MTVTRVSFTTAAAVSVALFVAAGCGGSSSARSATTTTGEQAPSTTSTTEDPAASADRRHRLAFAHVKYEVEGSTAWAFVTARNADGSTGQLQHAKVPLRLAETGPTGIEFDVPHHQFVYVSAQNEDQQGTITCRITVDGVVLQQATSKGGYTIATCSGTAP